MSSSGDQAIQVEVASLAHNMVAGLEALPPIPTLPLAVTRHRMDLGPASPGRDPLNAIVRNINVVGPSRGRLSGMRFSVKDSVAIGEIPMTCGSAALQKFVPTGDSSVVCRLLDEGAAIAAVTNMDDLAFAGSGETSVYGPTLNPFDRNLLAGGSSGGAAASLYYGDHDVAVGTDQGGSVRVPASWCGVLGFKPTHGMIPYTGVAAMEPTLDHVGLLARTVEPLTRTLEVLEGPDGHDLRQHKYSKRSAGAGISRGRQMLAGARLRILSTGCERASSNVRGAFDEALRTLQSRGAAIDVSDLDPTVLGPISSGLFVEGMRQTIAGARSSYGGSEFQWTEYTDALRRGVDEQYAVLSPQISATLTAARDLAATRPNHYYSRALCAREKLRSEYFDALRNVDFLIEPTVPSMPARIDEYDSAPAAIAERGWSVLANTCNANVVGFPSISLPLGVSHGIPVGVMVTAAPWNDYALLQFAQACESEIGWNPSLAVPEFGVERN